ncbi:ATP F0F1 synthase subunit B [Alsobacter sp. SYSU M60028]|uniref:ATP synthase subunit b n=1 Tax=Alsobacter ponti TaxID=2962936 RepID=A0ABT1LCM4_9HYPH|nr:ATP F0F1 synthase subunit B [Alsobacter ponti]MCP8939252.1 ATP F0F1 synthase subunit B [Alsobacter ponti]
MFFQTPEFWVAVAFFIFMGIAWKMGAFSSMATGLDKRGERIRAELEDARILREEAQKVLADYQRRRKEAEAEAEEIIRSARAEAERLAQDTQAKLADFVERRTKMAEQKIAQAEVQAAAEVRAAAAEAAVRASEQILRKEVAAGAGDRLVEQGIGEIRSKLN